MINVDLLIKDEKPIGYDITGHANFDKHGSDIVCSAVTILAYACVNTLDQYADKVDFIDDGDILHLETMDSSVEIDAVFAYFETGIQTLLGNYSDYVKLSYKEN